MKKEKTGRKIIHEKNPQRVATLIGSFADIWCLAGGKDALVATADDTWTQFDLALRDTVINLGAIKTPDTEKLIAAAPELVIASANTAADVDMLATLENANLTVAYFDVSTFEDYLKMLDICTKITGKTENYTAYGTDVKAQVDAAKAKADGSAPTVLYLRASGSSVKVKNSEGSVLGEMLAALVCKNIADIDTNLLEQLSMESILSSDPEQIFIVTQGSDPSKAQAILDEQVLSNPAWQQLFAVKNGSVHYMDQQLYNLKPNAKWGDAFENLAKILYAEK
ncbi:MAG: ABC transporter substrate-binding protein [Clostridia bacterium]|nr:ABC transporter substrate-binding protein [Clostridia bacterium]NLS84727.1 ABC transporter substrate-binding protein [Oscillospiraceae bacterium]